MEVEDFPGIDQSQRDVIFSSVSRNGRSRFPEEQVESIFSEIQLNHKRQLCRMAWEKQSTRTPTSSGQTSNNSHAFEQLTTVNTDLKTFEETKRLIHWSTLYVLPEVYDAARRVNEICQKLTCTVCLFSLDRGKLFHLREFEVQQAHNTLAVIKYLREEWVDRIIQSARMYLRDIGKGAFDLRQKNPYVYDVIKLRRFINMMVFFMQDALKTLVKTSTEKYANMLVGPAECALNVDIDFTWGDNLIVTQFSPFPGPIFTVELVMSHEHGAGYTTSPTQYQHQFPHQKIIIERLEEALLLCHKVKQPYASLLPSLTFPPESYLSSTGLLDHSVCVIREKLNRAYERAIIPLQAYAEEFNRYQDFYTMDPEKYIAIIEKEDSSTAAFQEKISFHRAARAELEKKVPAHIAIGPFHVVLHKLKGFLVEKHNNLSVRLLTLLTEKLKIQLDDCLFEYNEIRRMLREDPKSIEEVFKIREFMEDLPQRVATLTDTVNRLKLEYEVVENFKWNVPDEDFSTKWLCIGYPQLINEQIIETTDFLSECVEKFSRTELDDEMALSEAAIVVSGNLVELLRQEDHDKVHENAVDARRIWKSLKACQEQSVLLNERRRLFGMPPTDMNAQLNELERQLDPYKTLWCTASDWLKYEDMWMDNPLVTVDAAEMEMLVTDMQKSIAKCNKLFRDQPNMLSIGIDIASNIDAFKPYVGLMKSLRNPGIEAKHIEEMNSRTGIRVTLAPPSNLKGLVALGIMDFKDTVADVSDKATQEYTIGSALDKMMGEWEVVKMEILTYKETGTCIMKVTDEILIMLEEHMQSTQQIGYGPYRAFFEKRIDEWEGKLKLIQEVLMQWIKVQKAWMYLEPIFTSEDISRQLPMEAKKYKAMDRNWRRIMKKAQESPFILRTCPDKTLLSSLKECENLLEIVQRGLSNYLEAKRSTFPRFYFLSDDELLEILAQTKNVRAVQPHLNKCFENMKELRFEEDLEITRMYSADGEEVMLKSPIYPVGQVEEWLGQVELTMQKTLREIIEEALDYLQIKVYGDWVFMWPGQVVICANQIFWTAEVESAINFNSLNQYYEVMLAELGTLRGLIRGMPTHIQRLMLESLITIQVHARDVVTRLIEKSVGSMGDFHWTSQIRYYWENCDVKIHVINADFPYGYEYLGNNGRLVITPLTERCYLTLTGALHLKFGGAPSGPAGTGKTETTKDLAKAFAIQCVVFNCSDQLDYISMGKFFKGLASAGAWACFDEFNRIDIEVLSVIAQQILTIQQAQQTRASRFVFEGCDIILKPMCAVFITMNPGYAGRTELPDNLKALFRPVAMMVPNYALIAEISLFSYGFSEAKTLAVKITMTFKLSSEQLSSQDHYDFGMRAVKTVIAYAGNLKRQSGDFDEYQICVRALRDVNVPKFFKDDLKLFEGILSDLFPGLKALEADRDVLEAGIRETIRGMGLKVLEEQILKVIQLYETTTVRHGLMLVGPTGTGKTKCYQILRDACRMLQGQQENPGNVFELVETFVLNPKAITLGQLYGEFDIDTHEWTDGILPHMVRAGSSANDMRRKWYIFDGPVDAIWIENMNTVLDDNKKLCLTSGEIIKLSARQTIMFEVGDLKVASPATVSRCGMIYLESGTVGTEALIDCWIETLPQGMKEFAGELSKLTYQLLPPALTILRNQMREIVATVDVMMVQAYINLINVRFSMEMSAEGSAPHSTESSSRRNIRDLLTPWATFAIVWSAGASCDSENRWAFSEWLRTIQQDLHHPMQFPADGLVYDYILDEGGYTDASTDNYIPPRWIKWTDGKQVESLGLQLQFHDFDVPTMDSIRNSTIIGYLLQHKSNVLAVGPTGSGKTVTISRKLSRGMAAKYITDFIIFSAKTSAQKIQDLIDSKLEKRRTGSYGPPVSKRHIFFIDDLNMPLLEQYGAQPPLELLRQLLDFKGWYDTTDIGEFHEICDVNLIGAMQPPGGGRNSISERVLRHFHLIVFPEMEDEAKVFEVIIPPGYEANTLSLYTCLRSVFRSFTRKKIYGTIMKSWLIRGPLSIESLDDIVNATLTMYNTICQQFLPTPDKSHYTFNLRDFSRIFQGVLMAEPDKIDTRGKLWALWFHEVSRVMRDRLVNAEDLERFDEILRLTLIEFFGETGGGLDGEDSIFFADFCGPHGEYERIIDLRQMESVLLQSLEEYNETTNAPMNLVLFEEAMSHICRISRIIRQARGNALLLGMGGSGRQSLTRLSAFLGEHVCFQIESRRSYSLNDWHDDIKAVMLKAGLSRRSIVFIFSDTQIKDESYLEDIHNILNSGDVPNIYQKDELEKIYNDMRAEVQEAGLSLNRTNLFNAYLKNVRSNLHTVVTMSPIGDEFRRRIRQFPALVNCCTIDWFHPWSDTALQSVAVRFIKEIQDDHVTGDIFDAIVTTCQYMHSSTIDASQEYLQVLNRHNYVTPVSYLEMLSNYGNLLYKRKKALMQEMSRLSTGLNKLSGTESEVKQMQVILTEMKPELEQATVATSVMIDRIREDTIEAERTKGLAEEQQKEAAKFKRENEAIRNEADMELSQVKPMLQAAEASLKALNKGDITEVKAMKRPPVGVVLVIEAMCIVKEVKPNKVGHPMIYHSPTQEESATSEVTPFSINKIYMTPGKRTGEQLVIDKSDFWLHVDARDWNDSEHREEGRDWATGLGMRKYPLVPGKLPGEKVLDYWTPGSQMLADAGHFLRELENFDKSKITEEVINRLKAYIENPSFHPSKVIQVSKACHSLCLWLHAMYNWYFVNLKVEPKMEALKNAEMSLMKTEEQLSLAMEQLREVEDGIQRLEDILRIEVDKKTKLENEQQLCEERMSRAVRLIYGLADEQQRWITAIRDIQILYNNAVGDILISCGGIAYLTPFTDVYRRGLLSAWTTILDNKIPLSDNHTAVAVLGNPVEIQQWHINGLPRDTFSVENVILSRNANRWPLFIDPQRQVNKWIKKTEKTAGLLIARMTDKDLMRVVETCVKFGRPCLIENVECELESTLDSVLMKNVFSYGGQMSIKIGDNVVPYNDQFRLYLTTKLPNPHYPPEITVKVLIVNFALTKSGLLDQMLSLAVLQERPELEAVRRDIIISCADMKRDLKEIENKILDKLSKSEGSAVDDIDLITTLEASKLKSEEIKTKVASAEATQADIDRTRSAYLPVANRAQLLYFAISDLKTIDFMYQYSLEWFVNIFTDSIANTEKSTNINERVSTINEYLTFSTYSNVCRSLFEKHKLHFAFLICIRIQIDTDSVDTSEWRYFLSGGSSSQQNLNPAPEWLPERSWLEIQSLTILKGFRNFPKLFQSRLKIFKALYDSKEPELLYDFLSRFRDSGLESLNLNDFQKLLIIKSLRPDRLITAIQQFINKYLGRRFIEPQTTQLSTVYRESHAKTPLVFILSSGTDPAAELYTLAENEGMKTRFYTISLGQGQGPRAEFILKESLEAGNWVFFQNCHLAPSWMPHLDGLIESFPDNIHPDFRLYLTSTPTINFPPTILENAMKLTVEPPRGIKANMHRIYTTQIPLLHDLFESEDLKAKDIKSLLYSLCLFHSILLERRKFGSLGFNIPYEFSDGDLAICISQLQMFVAEYPEIPFEVLIYTAGHVNYGGRITDDWDRRCVLTLLHDFYNSEVLKDDHTFDAKGLYQQISTVTPASCTYEHYLNAIMCLPLNDEPEIFGLHYNAELSYATSEAYYCITNLAALQPQSTEQSTGGKTTIRVVVDNLLTRVPALFDVKAIQERHPVLYGESLNTVLQLEAKRYNTLLKIVSNSLSQLLAAVKGEIVMNEMLETMVSNLSMNNVPELWESRGYPSLKPLGAWMLDLNERIEFMQNWSDKGIPSSLWISGFFFPQALFTATLQNFARKYSLPIDTIEYSYQILEALPHTRAHDGCCLYGLFLEGCRWNGNTLEESNAKVLHSGIVNEKGKIIPYNLSGRMILIALFVSEMKPIFLRPEQIRKSPPKGVYNCPVYKTLTRSGTLSTTGHSTNFVLCMEIPTSRIESHWIKRGVAMICALDY
ncbi:dynein axonemal heavy chain 1-like [Diachasmimorpha longicaudata]|uniref:dynein axonemal heavy chain 1-like n=1 Tax=Diachasmimorpha longicaudata TaxID=58733 RepID=UPI0030B86FD5